MHSKMVSTALTLATFIVTPALAQKYAEQTQLPDRGYFDESGGRFIDPDPDVQTGFGLLNDAAARIGVH